MMKSHSENLTAEEMLSKAHIPVIVGNYLADKNYTPYCMRCRGLHRMRLIKPFLWKPHPTGAP